MQKQRGVVNILLVLLLVAALGAAGYFYLQNKSSTTQPQISPTTTQPQPTIYPKESINDARVDPNRPDPTASWTSHSSDRLSFKYPNDLTLEERQKNYFVLLRNPNNPQGVLISIDARLTNNYADYDNAVSSTKAGLTDVQVQEMSNGVQISGKVGPGYGEGQQITIALFRYQQGAIEAETTSIDPSELQIFNQMLSTFKFLK